MPILTFLNRKILLISLTMYIITFNYIFIQNLIFSLDFGVQFD